MKFRFFLSTFFMILSFQNSAVAMGPTYVRDAIGVSTEWTQANSPYVIQNDILVNKGAVLTVDPGVTVQFQASTSGKPGSGPNLVIQGGLRAIGNSQTPISFVPAVTGSLWGALYFSNSDSINAVLQGCLIKGGRIICNGCSPTITQCAIYGSKTGLEVLANSQAQIMGNRITANGVGIALLADSASPVISKNEIYNNNFGIYLKDFGIPTISDNHIYNNIKYNMVNYSVKPLAVPNNDFRLADAQQIMRTIYDGAYNPSYGRLNFMPFVGMTQTQTASVVSSSALAGQEKPTIQEEDFWSYGRPFDAMKVSNLDAQKKKPSSAIKILAIGATAVVTVVLLFI
jgi:parallel beta-helix repeat protein